MPAVRIPANESRPLPSDKLYWTGTIIVSVTIATDGAIKDAQSRIKEEVPARIYRLKHHIQLIENPLPATRQQAEEQAKQDAVRSISAARYPRRAVACRGEFTVSFKLPID